MAKRLTDSEKWEDPWFMDLSNEDRLLWLYVLDKCDHAGIWKVNRSLAEFVLKFKPDWDGFLEKCGGRVVVLKDKWFLPKFISFQYGVLNPDCRPHRPVIEILKRLDLKGYEYPIDTDKEQEQEKEQEKEGGVGETKGFPPSLEDCVEAFAEKGYSPAEAGKFWNHYDARGWMMGKNRMKKWKSAVATWISQGKQFGTLEKLPPKRVETSIPKEPEIRLSDGERRALIEKALPRVKMA